MIKFTYLDLIDSTISFQPIMANNWFHHQGKPYSLFSLDETKPFAIPGYKGKRCIIEIEMAKVLSRIQKQIYGDGLSLKVYDAYRPQRAVDFFTTWTEFPDTPIAKSLHYPRVNKKEFHDLSYLSRTSSHTLGTAVDVTIIHRTSTYREKEHDFLGLWDPESLDMGVGYLCFDERSSFAFDVTEFQRSNRLLLHNIMIDHQFEPLETEFWHYYLNRYQNREVFYDFEIRDDYQVNEDLTLCL